MPTPDKPLWSRMTNAQLVASLQYRLGIDQSALKRAGSWACALQPVGSSGKRQGQPCGRFSGPEGDHARSCGTGRRRTFRHDECMSVFAHSVLNGLTDIRNISVDRHVIMRTMLPAAVPPARAWPVPDCVIFGQPPIYFDFAVVSPQLDTNLEAGSGVTAGLAAAAKERDKLRHYECATGTGRPIAEGHMVPLVVESGGRLGEHMRAWMRKCAQRKAGQATGDKLNRDAAQALLHYRQLMSMTIQKLEADSVIEAGSYAFGRFAVPERVDPASAGSSRGAHARDRGRFGPRLADNSDFVTSTL